MDLSQNLIKYFRDCLSKEGFDQPLTDMFTRSHKDHVSSCGFFCGSASISSAPKRPRRWHNDDKLTFEALGFGNGNVDAFASTQLLKGQDYQLMLGLYPIAASIVDDEGKTQRIRAPLLQMPCDLSEGQPTVEALLSDMPISVDALEYNPAVLDLFDDPLPTLDFSSDMGCLDHIEAYLRQRLSEPGLNKDN